MKLNPSRIAGYLHRGEFAADLEEAYGDTAVATCSPSLDVGPFLERLSAEARPALQALDALIMGGKLRSFRGFDVCENWTYGFDFVANEVEVLWGDDEVDLAADVFCLGLDGGGNHFVQMLDGRVGIWNHEEGLIEDHTLFATLDELLWVLLRVAAATDGKVDRESVCDALASFPGETGPAFYLEQLRES